MMALMPAQDCIAGIRMHLERELKAAAAAGDADRVRQLMGVYSMAKNLNARYKWESAMLYDFVAQEKKRRGGGKETVKVMQRGLFE